MTRVPGAVNSPQENGNGGILVARILAGEARAGTRGRA